MTATDPRRLAALAHRLGVPPQAVLLAAASMAGKAQADPAAALAGLRAGALRSDATAASLALLRTPPAAYALGHVEDALATLWGPAAVKTP